MAVAAAAVGAVHPPGSRRLLAGAAGQGALELEEGAADLVAHGGLAFLVMDGPAATEEATMARGGSGGGCGVVVVVVGRGRGVVSAAASEERHFGLFVLLRL